MTDNELLALIASNADCQAAYESGDDVRTAELLSDLLPLQLDQTWLTDERGVIVAFAGATGDPTTGEAFLQKLEVAGLANPLVQRMLRWMGPGAPGIALGLPSTQALLDGLAVSEIITTDERDIAKAIPRRPQAISYTEVSELRSRTNG